MPITIEQMREIAALVGSSPVDAGLIAKLRGVAPGVTATRCDAADMVDETPYQSHDRANLYLLDGRDHCARVTNDPAVATGVIVAVKGNGA